MFKRFDDYGAALEFGRKFGQEHGCYVHCVTVRVQIEGPQRAGFQNYPKTRSVAFVATSSSYHKLHGIRGASHSPGSGWHFGGIGVNEMDPRAVAILAESDEPALPGRGEYWYGLFAGYTTGFTHAEIVEMSAETEKNGTGVWHESAMLARRKNPGKEIKCHCGMCNPETPAPQASAPRRNRTRLGRHRGY